MTRAEFRVKMCERFKNATKLADQQWYNLVANTRHKYKGDPLNRKGLYKVSEHRGSLPYTPTHHHPSRTHQHTIVLSAAN